MMKLLMRIDFFNGTRRSFGLLILLTVLSINGCKENRNSNLVIVNDNELPIKEHLGRDSITISVSLPKNGATGFNIFNNFFDNQYVEFRNKSEKDSIITKTIPSVYGDQVIFNSFYERSNDTTRHVFQPFFIEGGVTNLHFELNKDHRLNLKDANKAFRVYDLYDEYTAFEGKINTSLDGNKTEFMLELEEINNSYKAKFDSSNRWKKPFLEKLNNYHYFYKLQKLSPSDETPDVFLRAIERPITGFSLRHLFYMHAKNRVHTFDYKKLNTKNYSEEYISNVSLGVFAFLKHDINKGDKEYQAAIDWLRSSDWYQKNHDIVEKGINPLDNEQFKTLLGSLNFLDISFKETTFFKIIKQRLSEYYLIDFWATWCKPCIAGVKIMEEKEIPENVAVISLSLDKYKIREKWKNVTLKLEQDITYLVNDQAEGNIEFVRFMELQAIPRYILIDQDMNLIDESFTKPHEPDFEKNLRNIKN